MHNLEMVREARAAIREILESPSASQRVKHLALRVLLQAFEGRTNVTVEPDVAAVKLVAEPAAVKPTEPRWDVILASSGSDKIRTIQAIREVTGLALKEAQDIIEDLPQTIKADVSGEEADKVAKKIAEAGATTGRRLLDRRHQRQPLPPRGQAVHE